MTEAVICEPVRTAVGRYGGMFRDVPAQLDRRCGIFELVS